MFILSNDFFSTSTLTNDNYYNFLMVLVLADGDIPVLWTVNLSTYLSVDHMNVLVV